MIDIIYNYYIYILLSAVLRCFQMMDNFCCCCGFVLSLKINSKTNHTCTPQIMKIFTQESLGNTELSMVINRFILPHIV